MGLYPTLLNKYSTLIVYLGIENLMTMRKLDSHMTTCSRTGYKDAVADTAKELLQSHTLTTQNIYSIVALLAELIGASQEWIAPSLEEWLRTIMDFYRT